ncbi:molybdenum cofactor guanylyltransferase [Paenibacillus sp. Marseille-P2973]|nr:molybdenum cofactor guanylyltransferase [Paenibacillus sp. Marseille-P2973]
MTAIILAGGRSSRMGSNKALLPLQGIPVIERLVRELDTVVGRVIIAGGNQPEAYSYLGKEIFSDVYPGAGPLAGLHAGLTAAETPWSLAVACDMPFASREVFEWLVERVRTAEKSSGPEAIIPVVQGRVQPLLAAYRRNVLTGLEKELQAGSLKMTRWTEGLHAEYADGAEIAAATGLPLEQIPFNMNRPDDYRQALDWLDRDHKGNA